MGSSLPYKRTSCGVHRTFLPHQRTYYWIYRNSLQHHRTSIGVHRTPCHINDHMGSIGPPAKSEDIQGGSMGPSLPHQRALCRVHRTTCLIRRHLVGSIRTLHPMRDHYHSPCFFQIPNGGLCLLHSLNDPTT